MEAKTGIGLVFALFCVSTTGLCQTQFVTLDQTATQVPVVDDSVFFQQAPNECFYGAQQSQMQSGVITGVHADTSMLGNLPSGQQLSYLTVTFSGSFTLPAKTSGNVTVYEYDWDSNSTYSDIAGQQTVPFTAGYKLTAGALTLTIPGNVVLAAPSDEPFSICVDNGSFNTSGYASLVNSNSPEDIEAFTAPTAVPEPATWLSGALLAAVGGYSLVRRRA